MILNAGLYGRECKDLYEFIWLLYDFILFLDDFILFSYDFVLLLYDFRGCGRNFRMTRFSEF